MPKKDILHYLRSLDSVPQMLETPVLIVVVGPER
jgi:hypothetical protein